MPDHFTWMVIYAVLTSVFFALLWRREPRQQAVLGLKIFFGMVGVSTEEQSPHGPVECKARNPVPVKTLMNILGMPAGPCRQPLGKMTRAGFDYVRGAARQVQANDPELLAPIDLAARM